jgi:hypothetical protein
MGRNSSVFSMVNQVCGQGLLARADPGFSNDVNCAPLGNTPEAPVATTLLVTGGAAMIAVTAFAVRRRRRQEPQLPA